MNMIFQTVVQWLHLVAAIAALGGTIFLVMVAFPVLGRMGDQFREQFQERAHSKVMMLILHSYGLLILTGFFNLVRAYSGEKPTQLYGALIAIKVFLAIGLFAIGFMLLVPSESLKEFQARRPFWMRINALLGLVIVLLSAWLRLENQYGEREDPVFREEPATNSGIEEFTVEIPDSVDI